MDSRLDNTHSRKNVILYLHIIKTWGFRYRFSFFFSFQNIEINMCLSRHQIQFEKFILRIRQVSFDEVEKKKVSYKMKSFSGFS